MAMSILGAVTGSTIIAAATTETVSLPGFHHVASFIFSKNAPPESVRIVEDHGHVYRMRFTRHPGEPWDVVHLEETKELTPSEVAGSRHDDGTMLDDPPFHG
ncbi:hypothetical protein [Methylobacterium oryzae]|uniref:hypothetical protein n=1 Tax=Methylobacterium oryzae TaxID=334852 RepID=UPI001F2ED4B8|nr:hypothetical protein [Methylobacterium oryzae]UIN38380.1 hypothetical protein LXM90_30830 [Methylobacterium oryzae]